MYITNEIELLERIKKVIQIFAKGKAAPFARKIGVNERYVTRYIKEERGDWFLGYMKDICKAYPTLSERWLYSGEGDMLVPERPNPIHSITNQEDELIGDLLWVFFDKKDLVLENIIKDCVFDETFRQVMESSRFPTFSELETLHKKYGLNTAYLFKSDAEDIKNYPLASTLEKLKNELKQAEKENKLLNARLLDVLTENSQLNKELRKKTETISHNQNEQGKKKEATSAFGKTPAKDTKKVT